MTSINLVSYWFDSLGIQYSNLPHLKACTWPIRLSRLVFSHVVQPLIKTSVEYGIMLLVIANISSWWEMTGFITQVHVTWLAAMLDELLSEIGHLCECLPKGGLSACLATKENYRCVI